MARLLAAFTGWRDAGVSLAPYVLLAVFMPGGMAVAPLLYWRRRKQLEAARGD